MPALDTVVGNIIHHTLGFTGVVRFKHYNDDKVTTFRMGYLKESLITKYGRRVVAIQLITRNDDGHWYGLKIVPIPYDTISKLKTMEFDELIAQAVNKEQV